MSVRGRPCKAKSPDSSEPETKTRQKQAPQPRCSAAEKTNGTRRKKGDLVLKETLKEKGDSILEETLKILKIKKEERSNVAKEINDIKKQLINHLKEKTQLFKEVQEPLNTGSYYEKVKISIPDEFDVMLPLLVERVNIEPFKEDGAFYKVALKRENNPLKALEKDGFLPASQILAEFRKEVKKILENFEECSVHVLLVKIELFLFPEWKMVKSSWPAFTQEGFKIEGWLGAKTKQEHKRKHFYLVPKYEGKGSVEHNGVASKDAWRISFSHIEKEILKNHGLAKTCCEKDGESCCRKDCLKLLKHLLHLLKERDSSLKDVCSYHAKTTLLHACCARNKDDDWKASELLGCFKQLLLDFQGHLKAGKLPNFFVPGQNLLSGITKKTLNNLAKQIEEQLLNGFPIFASHSDHLLIYSVLKSVPSGLLIVIFLAKINKPMSFSRTVRSLTV
uniref:Cyclic GMP-AMP synthase a n=1 Tax=Oryzias sinensis TaxID=183150 RepID=A0A8C7XRV3_9TELE